MMKPDSPQPKPINCSEVHKYRKVWRKTLYVSFLTTLKPTTPRSSRPQRLWFICKCAILISAKWCTTPSGRDERHHVIEIEKEIQSEANEQDEDETKKKIHCMMKEKDLVVLEELGGVTGVARAYSADLETISDGFQQLDEVESVFKVKSFWSYFLMALRSTSIALLLALAPLSAFLGTMEEGPKYGWDEGILIFCYAFLVMAVSSTMKYYRAKRRQEEEMLEKKSQREIHVSRDAKIRRMPIFDIEEGDLIYLKQGDRVPADGLLIHGKPLVLDGASNSETSNYPDGASYIEASNGQDVASDGEIRPDHGPFLCFGSEVIQGSCWMLVIFKNNEMEPSRIIDLIKDHSMRGNLFEDRIQKHEACMDAIKLFFSVLITFVLLARFISGKDDDERELPEFKGKVCLKTLMKISEAIGLPRGKIKTLISSIATCIISFQHGMAMAYTISILWWKHKFSLNGPIVQNFSACGTMGFVTVIIIDVSSRLISKQVVDKLYIHDTEIRDDHASTSSQKALQTLIDGFGAFVLAQEAADTTGDEPLFSWLRTKWRAAIETAQKNFLLKDSRSLKSHLGECHGVLIEEQGDGTKNMYSHWRGAALMILPMCSHYQDAQGNSHIMDAVSKDLIERRIQGRKASDPMPLAFAYKQTHDQQVKGSELTLSAILLFKHQYKEGIESVILALKPTDVVIKQVAEDDLMIAKSISQSSETYEQGNEDKIIAASKFRDLTDDDWKSKVDQIEMMAECRMEDKVQLIESFKEKEHVVAFIGGMEISDVHVMVQADVGISIGEDNQGTGIGAKISHSIILDCGTHLQMLVHHGRNMYFNIQKLIQFELTAGIASLLICSLLAMAYGDSPLSPFQSVWVNIMMFLLGIPVLLLELPDKMLNLMITTEPSRSATAISKNIREDIIGQVAYQIVVMLTLYYAGNALADDGRIIKPMISTSFVLCQVFHISTVLKLQKAEALRNFGFLGVLGGILATQVLLVQFGTSLAFYVKLNGIQWTICFALTAPCLIFDWAIRCITNHLSKMLERLMSVIGVHNLSGIYVVIFLFCVLMFL